MTLTEPEGVKASTPLLETVPLLAKDPENVCVSEEPENEDPAATVNVPFTIQPTPGPTPALLLTVTSVNVGDVDPVNVGETLPLNCTEPVLENPALRAIDCAPVPVKMTIPPLESDPLFARFPEKVTWVPPAWYDPEIVAVPLTVTSPVPE
jgi:hypothetical protein